MIKVIKRILIIVGASAIFSIVFYLTLFFGNKIIIEKDSNFITNGLSAFMGALFAFLFVVLGKLFAEIYSRNKRHRNALVEAEYVLNEYLGINYDNVFLINGFIEAINRNFVCTNHFTKLEINKSVLLNLYNIDLINDLHTLNIDIYKTNESLETATSWYNKINESFLDKKMIKEDYDINLKQISEKFQTLKIFLESLEEKIIIVQAKIRVLLKEESVVDWFIKFVSHKEHYPNNFDKKYNEEIKKVKTEIERNTEVSKKEISNL